jgi:CheY-like chemotaxis protein
MMIAPKKILLADDNPHDVELTLSALRTHPVTAEVEVVGDGEEALDYLFSRGKFADRRPCRPAVLLLAATLAKVDGVDVLRQVRADPGLRMLPVVMLASSREEQRLVESYRLGANSYVVKPGDPSAFVDAIQQLALFWVMVNQPPPETRKETASR